MPCPVVCARICCVERVVAAPQCHDGWCLTRHDAGASLSNRHIPGGAAVRAYNIQHCAMMHQCSHCGPGFTQAVGCVT